MTSTPERSFRWLRFFLVALPFFALDQFFKWLTVTRLELGQSWEPIPAIADVIRVTRSFNTGAAFGMFPAGSNLFLALAFVVAGIFVYLYPRLPDYASLSRIAISMISAGALSNAIDRVRFDHVVDYVHVQIGTISNVSNFADHIIFVGVVLLMIDQWRIERIEAQHTQQESGDAPEAGEDIAQADLIQDESLIEVVSVEAAPVPLENLSTEEVGPQTLRSETGMAGRQNRARWTALIGLMAAVIACNVPGVGSNPQPIADLRETSTPLTATDVIPLEDGTATYTPIPDLLDQPTMNPPTLTPTAVVTNTPGSGLTNTPLPTFTSTFTITPTPSSTLPVTNTPPPTFTPPATATRPAQSGATSAATALPAASATPTAPSGSGGSITPDSAGNRLANPGLEGDTRWVDFVEINILPGWFPFYCAPNYVPGGCPTPRPCSGGQTGGCNPPDNMQGRPEFKKSVESHRVHGGSSSQQWFCFWHACSAGIYQTFATTPGKRCEVGAYVYAWSNYDHDSTSELDSADDKANATWIIKVDPNGGTNAFGTGLLQSRAFTYDDGIYDQFVKINFVFTAQSSSATVFFENQRIWPIPNNDSFVDDAYAHCAP